MRRSNKFELAVNIFECFLILVAIFLAAYFVVSIDDIQGNGKVVNYSGFVRGSTQRLIKLELSGQPDDVLMNKLDALLGSLKNGGGEYNLRKVSAPGFTASLEKQSVLWESLKKEIYLAREHGPESTDLLAMSEDYFKLADQTVREVEMYSDDIAADLKTVEIAFILNLALVVAVLVYKTAVGIVLKRKNDELNDLAFCDAHTGLPNKGSCDRLLVQNSVLNPSQNDACIMFDLNNLKTVNDTLGHKMGDTLIMSFASIIRNTIPKSVFVGRYGGDEFIAVLFDTNEEFVNELLSDVAEQVRLFNEAQRDIAISYAVGYQMSDGCGDCSLQMLLNKADQKMYVDKEKKKPRQDNCRQL